MENKDNSNKPEVETIHPKRSIWRTYDITDGLPAGVQCLRQDRQGYLWLGTKEGLCRYDGAKFILYTTAEGLADNNVSAICEDHLGRLWFGTGGGVSYFDGQRFQTYTTAEGLANNGVLAICEDRQGRLWFGTQGGGVSCFDGHGWTTYTTEDGLLDNHVVGIIQDGEGHFWFAHHHSGLTRFDAETLQLLTDETVSEILLQDRQGRLWFDNETELYCLFEGQQCRQTFNAAIFSLLEDSRGVFWVGTNGDGLYCYDFDQVSINSTRRLNPAAESADVVREKADGAQRHPEKWGKRFTTEDGLESNSVLSLLETQDGTIWVGTQNPGYLYRFDGKAFEAIPTPHRVIFRLFEDSQGRIWMGGFGGGGLSCYDGEKLVTYTMADGLSDERVQSIMADDTGGLWIGTGEGLCCFDGKRFLTYGKAQGLFSLHHQWSTKDATGQLWFGTLGGGLYRTDGKHFQWLTTEDGLPSNSVTGLVPQPDGSMIISTYRGIVHYRKTATLPPQIEIREVVAGQIYPQPDTLELTTTQSSLVTIVYHGLSLSTHKMRYSYILEGYDKEWQDTWESQVSYEQLPPGEYTFRVIAINRDLVPSNTPATLTLTVVPDARDVALTRLQNEVNHLRREISRKYHFDNIIGRSTSIQWVYELMEKAIDSGLAVLISGETGTGKELVAKAIHYQSPRKNYPLLDLNCGAMPKELVASRLFGHCKGAFTSADKDQIGIFEAAVGGTVLLDEIGEMPPEAQVHLLRVLQERKVQRIGESQSRDVDVRVIAVTNRDLLAEVQAGRFREDLYYRLKVFPIHLPALRQRLDDIPLLAEHLLQKYRHQNNKDIGGFAPGVFEMLQSYNWPGNVRELESAINYAAAFVETGQHIQIYHFPAQITPRESLIQEVLSEHGTYRELLDQFQRRLIENALKTCSGNRHQAAKMLGIDRSNLVKLMKRLGIDKKDL